MKKLVLADLTAEDVVDGVYRYFGGDWVRISNMELTGKRYSEVIPEAMRADMEPYHKALHTEGLIGRRMTTSYVDGRAFMRVDMVEFVLSDNGETASQYLALGTIAPDEAPRPY